MKTGKNSQYPFQQTKMSTTTTTTTPSGTSGEAVLSATPKTESRYMMFKNKRVKEIMHDSKQPETSYPGILNKRDAGRIAKFEWDRDNGKAPFSQLRTKRFKVAINELLPEFRYPEITTVPPPAVGREEYRKFAYNYTMGMLVNFFNTFSSIFTSFDIIEGTGFENKFFRLKRDFLRFIHREGIESVHNSYEFSPWIQAAENERRAQEERRSLERRRNLQIKRFCRSHENFLKAIIQLSNERIPIEYLSLIVRNPRTRFLAHNTATGVDIRPVGVSGPSAPKAKLMPEHIKKEIVRLKQLTGEKMDDCPICLCELDSDFVITHCGHAYCKGCMNNLLESSRERSSGKVCAVCREGILA